MFLLGETISSIHLVWPSDKWSKQNSKWMNVWLLAFKTSKVHCWVEWPKLKWNYPLFTFHWCHLWLSAGEDYRGRFTINSHTGAISTTQVLDREEMQNYTLNIQARDYGPTPLSSFTQLHLVLLDQNDNIPSFTRKSYHASISEGLPAGAEVLRVSASDPDEGSNGEVTYSLTDDNSQGAFLIDAFTGAIRTTRSLDRESRAQYSLRAVATDGCTQGPLSSLASVTIQVEDVNDNMPVCEQTPFNAWVSMRTLPNQIVTTVTAADGDQGENGTIHYALSDEENLFDINTETGEISLRRRVRAGFSGRKLQVVVSDRGHPALTSTCLVFIHLKGEHEGLQFTSKVYNASVKENSRAGTLYLFVLFSPIPLNISVIVLVFFFLKALGLQRWRPTTKAAADKE